MKITNKEYIKELNELKGKMVGAEKFAEYLPIFKDKILERKLQKENEWINFGEYYKGVPYKWGINRGRFISDSSRNITNCNEKYDKYLFNLYFNTISLYDSHEKHGLDKLGDIKGVFFYDRINSTFYIEEFAIEEFLDKAKDWYENAIKEDKKLKNESKIKKLQEELELLNNPKG